MGEDWAGGRLLGAMIEESPYRAYLAPITADAVRIARANTQIHDILERMAAAGRRPAYRWFGRARASADDRILLAFLEYLAFASPKFLASVGEWPLGARRG